VLDIKDEAPREIYGFDLSLVRPDLHVVWRGNQIREDAGAIADVVTGRAAASNTIGNCQGAQDA